MRLGSHADRPTWPYEPPVVAWSPALVRGRHLNSQSRSYGKNRGSANTVPQRRCAWLCERKPPARADFGLPALPRGQDSVHETPTWVGGAHTLIVPPVPAATCPAARLSPLLQRSLRRAPIRGVRKGHETAGAPSKPKTVERADSGGAGSTKPRLKGRFRVPAQACSFIKAQRCFFA
jgi:hypothetical protein